MDCNDGHSNTENYSSKRKRNSWAQKIMEGKVPQMLAPLIIETERHRDSIHQDKHPLLSARFTFVPSVKFCKIEYM